MYYLIALSLLLHFAAATSNDVIVTVFSPVKGEIAGYNGSKFSVDISLDSASASANSLLSDAAGYYPYFNAPTSKTFHPGPAASAPGLVVLLSTTRNILNTPFRGPKTNLAGLFQINGVAIVNNVAEIWNTWVVGKPLFGTNIRSMLTVFVVSGTAPGFVDDKVSASAISNIVQVPFYIAGVQHKKAQNKSNSLKRVKRTSVSVLSPGSGDISGKNGTGFVVDILLESNSTFDPRGLVVMLSTTKNNNNTLFFRGPNTNLAKLFQLNATGYSKKKHPNEKIHIVNSIWFVAKPMFGVGVDSTLTSFLVKGTAPDYVYPGKHLKLLSNVAKVDFTISH